MFTGLIEDVGEISALSRRGKEARVRVRTHMALSAVRLGDSIAVDGACLTVVRMGEDWFEADVSDETLKRTSLASARVGTPVNLEQALRLGDRLGGHMVQGHVDGVGRVAAVDTVGDGWEVTWEIPDALLDTVVEKGSIAIDGISLTVARLHGARVTAAVVPHTATQTTVTRKAAGTPVNVETDLIGKYVRRVLGRVGSTDADHGGLTLAALEKAGFA